VALICGLMEKTSGVRESLTYVSKVSMYVPPSPSGKGSRPSAGQVLIPSHMLSSGQGYRWHPNGPGGKNHEDVTACYDGVASDFLV